MHPSRPVLGWEKTAVTRGTGDRNHTSPRAQFRSFAPRGMFEPGRLPHAPAAPRGRHARRRRRGERPRPRADGRRRQAQPRRQPPTTASVTDGATCPGGQPPATAPRAARPMRPGRHSSRTVPSGIRPASARPRPRPARCPRSHGAGHLRANHPPARPHPSKSAPDPETVATLPPPMRESTAGPATESANNHQGWRFSHSSQPRRQPAA